MNRSSHSIHRVILIEQLPECHPAADIAPFNVDWNDGANLSVLHDGIVDGDCGQLVKSRRAGPEEVQIGSAVAYCRLARADNSGGMDLEFGEQNFRVCDEYTGIPKALPVLHEGNGERLFRLLNEL